MSVIKLNSFYFSLNSNKTELKTSYTKRVHTPHMHIRVDYKHGVK